MYLHLYSNLHVKIITYHCLPLAAIFDYSNAPIYDSLGAGASPGDERCRIVAIFSDRDVENNETFLMELTSSDSASVTNGMAIVTIRDNDS